MSLELPVSHIGRLVAILQRPGGQGTAFRCTTKFWRADRLCKHYITGVANVQGSFCVHALSAARDVGDMLVVAERGECFPLLVECRSGT